MAILKVMKRNKTVVDFNRFKERRDQEHNRLIRLAPEIDGLETLYTNDMNPGVCFNLNIIAWGMRKNGDVVGLVPWLDKVIPCPDFTDVLNGHWAGYYNPLTKEMFHEPPMHKIIELKTAHDYFQKRSPQHEGVVQELPETLGTHALLTDDDFKSIYLHEIISWRLLMDGKVEGMISDYDIAEDFPILMGDESLYAAETHPDFKYYFHLALVTKLKQNDPEALNALALLSQP